MATVLNVTEILKRSDGSEVRISGDAKFYAQSNYANLLLIDVEDGGSLQANALINFTQQTRQSFTSHDFFVKPVGIVTRVVNEEIISAYQYAIQVPKLVLQNNTKEVIESKLTFKIASGTNYQGYYATLSALNTALPPTEELETDKAVAYVVATEEFYQVLYNSTSEAYEWTIVEYLDMLLVTKQYSLSSIYIQGGFSSPQGIAPISASNTQVIMSILNDLQILYNSLNDNYTTLSGLVDDIIDGTQQIAFDKTGTDLNSDFIDDAIKEVNTKSDANAQNITDMKDGTDAFSEITLGTPPNVVTIRYIHTNGNNFQVVGILYPDGREANIDEEMYVNFRNESGGTRDSGIFLMTDGLSTGNQAVKGILFNPTSQHARKFLGVVTVDGVGVNQKSKATRFGIVHGIPTTRFRTTGTAYAEGQYLWATADGLLSNVAPTKPALQINVGIIINLQGGNADILVCPIVYGAFGDSSDVIITTPTNGDIPILGSDGIWRNSQRLVTAEADIDDLQERVVDLETANMIKSYTYNPSTHVLTFTYYDNSTTSFDLPLESAIVDASYDNVTKDITFTLQSGATLVVPLDDLISGLASETWVTTYFIPKTSIVDNLTTDDATKVLSAKQGKYLFDNTNFNYDITYSNSDSIRITKSNGNFIFVSQPMNIYARRKFSSADYRVLFNVSINYTLENNDILYWDLSDNLIKKNQISSVILANTIILAFVSFGNIQFGSLIKFIERERLYNELHDINFKTFKSYDFEWEFGGLTGLGVPTVSVTRIRTKKYYDFSKPIKIDFDNSDGWRYGFQLYDENQNFIYDFGWQTQGMYYYPFGNVKKARFVMSKTNDTLITDIKNSNRLKFNDVINKNIYYNDEGIVRGIAHRGIATIAPENTISSLRLASYSGFRYVECDVQLTSDNKWVVIHDTTINRTSNGVGSVSTMTLNELKMYDFGSWKAPMYIGETIPTLEEYIIEAKKHKIKLYIELKINPNVDRINELLDILYTHGVVENTTIISMERLALKDIVDIDSKINVGWITNSLSSTNVNIVVTDLKKQNNKVCIHLYGAPIINKTDVLYARKNGIDVETSVLNDISSIYDAVLSGVNGISTDYINIQEALNV